MIRPALLTKLATLTRHTLRTARWEDVANDWAPCLDAIERLEAIEAAWHVLVTTLRDAQTAACEDALYTALLGEGYHTHADSGAVLSADRTCGVIVDDPLALPRALRADELAEIVASLPLTAETLLDTAALA